MQRSGLEQLFKRSMDVLGKRLINKPQTRIIF